MKRLSIDQRIALLKQTEFQRDVRTFIRRDVRRLLVAGLDRGPASALWRAHFEASSTAERKRALRLLDRLNPHEQEVFIGFCESMTTFATKWRCMPPLFEEVLGDDVRRKSHLAVMAGRWAVIPVFPWTTEHDVRRALRRIRSSPLQRQHRDANSTVQGARSLWLRFHGHRRHEISHALWRRHDGRARPSRSKIVREMSVDEETARFRKAQVRLAMRLGRTPTYLEIERELFRKAGGTERPANAQVRMAEYRFRRVMRDLKTVLTTPEKNDPVSHRITMMLRWALRLEHRSMADLRRDVRALYRAVLSSPRA